MLVGKFRELFKNLSRLSKRERVILYGCIVVLAVLFLDRLIVQPVYSSLHSLNTEIADKKAGIVRALRILAQKSRIEAEAAKFASFRQVQAPEEEIVTSLQKEITDIGNASSLYIVDMKPSGIKEEKGKIKKYMVTVTAEGQMEQVMAFMYAIENSTTMLTIEKYQLAPKSKESSIAQSTMTISKAVL